MTFSHAVTNFFTVEAVGIPEMPCVVHGTGDAWRRDAWHLKCHASPVPHTNDA